MTDDQKVVQVLSKVIVNTVKNMMGDYDQTVAQKLKNIQISGDNILPMSIDSTKIQKGSIQMADIENLEAKIAEIVQLDVARADISYAQIYNLDTYMATIAYAKIDWLSAANLQVQVAEAQYAKVGQLFADQAEIKYLATDVSWEGSALIQKGIADEFYMNRLAVNQAQIVDLMVDSAHISSLSVDKIKVLGQDGNWYKLVADETGVMTELVKLNGAAITDGSASGSIFTDGALSGAKIAGNSLDGSKIVTGSITAGQLNASSIFANDATIQNLIAANLDVNTLFARQATFGKITTNHLASDVGANLDLSSNQSIILRSAKAIDGMNLLLGTREGRHLTTGSGQLSYAIYYSASDAGNAILSGNTTDTFTLSFNYAVDGNEGDTVTVTPFMYKSGEGAPRHGIVSGTQVNCGSSGTLSFSFTLSSALAAMIPAVFTVKVDGAAGIPFSLSEMKLEKGDTATTYNYALEEGSETLDSQLSVMNDKIRAEVTDEITTVTQDTADSLKTELTGEIEATADTITQRVSVVESNQDELSGNYAEIVTKVDGVTTTVQDMSNQQAKWFYMGTDGLEIGERTLDPDTGQWEAGDFTTLLNNTKLAFKQNGEEVAYISNLALLITQAAIKDTLTLGGLSGVLDGYAINWVFNGDAPLVRRNYFSGTATPNSITMISSDNFKDGTEISIVPAGQALINGNTTDTFTVSFDYKLTGVVSAAPDFEIGMLFLSSEVGESYVWPVRVGGGNNFSTIEVNGVSNTYTGRFVSTFKLTVDQAEAAITKMHGYIRTATGVAGFTPTLTISNLKLEKNDTATPWVKALEDPYTNTNS